MFQIDRFGRKPIYEQVIEQVEQLVATGTLHPGDQLPSVRALSQTLSANPNTLQKAYTELERRGITFSAPGKGRFISQDAPRLVVEGMDTSLNEVTDLSRKLHSAGIPLQRVLDAVQVAYPHPSAAQPTSLENAND